MSAQPQGPGWWQASDGNWYPPEGQVAAAAPPLPPPGVGLQASPYPVAYGQPGPVAGAQLSTPGKRFGAYLLDGVLVFVTLIIGWVIWSLIIWSKGQSPGKSLLGMRCIRSDTGRCASFGDMALRELVGKGILGSVTFGITTIVGGIMILGDTREGLWDKMAHTIVVDDPTGRFAPT
jgi:uncharacterized RDD family membrane protein YckC